MEFTNKQKNGLSGFVSTYRAFVNTLADTYKDNKELAVVRQQVTDLKTPEAQIQFLEQWWASISPHVNKIKNQDASLFVGGVQCLLALQLPQLWVSDKLSLNSKKYVWLYLKSLTKNARAFVDSPVGASSGSGLSDIQPPMELPDIPGIKQIYENMPGGILQKVQSIAERYGQEIESGEKSIENIKFDEISQELFAGLNQEDMKGLVANVGQVLQSLSGGGGGEAPGGEMPDLSQLFNFMNKS